MVWRFLFLVLLVSCVQPMCPDGFVSSTLNDSRVCISALSYCVSDDQCSSAQFDCKRPCVNLPVNVLFSLTAQEKARSCDVSGVRCKQVPFVDNRCVGRQCVSTPHTAEELIPQPAYQEVVPGKIVCYERRGFDSILRLNVLNNASIPLQQLEAYVNVSLRNGSTLIAQVDLLNKSLSAGESFEVKQRINGAVPSSIFVFAVRPVKGQGVEFGVKNEDIVFSSTIHSCGEKVFK